MIRSMQYLLSTMLPCHHKHTRLTLTDKYDTLRLTVYSKLKFRETWSIIPTQNDTVTSVSKPNIRRRCVPWFPNNQHARRVDGSSNLPARLCTWEVMYLRGYDGLRLAKAWISFTTTRLTTVIRDWKFLGEWKMRRSRTYNLIDATRWSRDTLPDNSDDSFYAIHAFDNTPPITNEQDLLSMLVATIICVRDPLIFR